MLLLFTGQIIQPRLYLFVEKSGIYKQTHKRMVLFLFPGDNVTYTNWEPGRNDFFFHSLEDCVSLGSYEGRWEDESCSHTYGYVCEFSKCCQLNFRDYICEFWYGRFTDWNMFHE